ncbi:TIGR03084 family protein [Amycolatopsis sp. WAC 01376]|uniref:TIGR03084 family metal-binding protein n=1 Tax=Amycolatopsis sp. WAC 01376 TaxID=2203195 RepID=UPI000F79EFC4|nr:TIGR03084 family metal-binding protein [Amycolatopsis sp. WAC 01376]RSM55432.1 TIGR03084 family protein [Amycolatopsis sp. WAC 01376]
MAGLREVIQDLDADGDELDALLASLTPEQWATPTPAPGWTIAHQVAHLAATFRMAGLAAADPEGFKNLAGSLGPDFDANVHAALSQFLPDPPDVLFDRWKAERTAASKALAAVDPAGFVPWLVNPLPPSILASAGMMEMFAHGQDIADALGVRRTRTERLGHLVAFAVRTWDFGYLARGLTAPAEQFRFDLVSPAGTHWGFGPEDATQRVEGPAEDFCLLVTRRRHHSDLALVATGEHAAHWLEIAQAYRGPAGEGREAGQFSQGS